MQYDRKVPVVKKGVKHMLFQDNIGNVLTSDDLLSLEIWEIEEKEIHLYRP